MAKLNQKFMNFIIFGLGEPYPVSSVNAKGIGDVLDAIYEYLPPK